MPRISTVSARRATARTMASSKVAPVNGLKRPSRADTGGEIAQPRGVMAGDEDAGWTVAARQQGAAQIEA